MLLLPLLLFTPLVGAPRPSDLELDPVRLQIRVDEVLRHALPATVGLQIGRERGSGVLVSADGLVMTAAHVSGVPGLPATVLLSDGTRLRAVTLGGNLTTDAGLVRIEEPRDEPYPFVSLPAPGENEPRVGDWCLALGHPGGYQAGRPAVPRLGRLQDLSGAFVRSDCPIIFGDSGGPLFDLDGNLLGIHSRIERDVGDNYHAPASAYRIGWERLLAGESWRGSDARLGIRAARVGVDGVRIEAVVEESAAAAAGLRAEDVLLRIAGERLLNLPMLRRFLGDLRPGDTVEVVARRGTTEITVSITLDGSEERSEEGR